MNFNRVRRLGSVVLAIAGLALSLDCSAQVVGSLTGQFSVSPTGAATYNIPIDLPPGVGGMTPQLAVSYNSQGADTYISPGFGIAGLSQIARCPANASDDGYEGGVAFNTSDRFCLDGQRLVTAGNYGAVGQLYRTQLESYSSIQSVGGSAGNPAYFIVKTKSGLTMTYGTASQFYAGGNTGKPLVWLLDQTVDSVGNYINYHYTLPTLPTYDGAYFPSEIDYGGNLNQGTPANIAVKFSYVTYNGDHLDGYWAGGIIDWNQKLNQITVNDGAGGSAAYKSWTFNYTLPFVSGAEFNRTLLTSVQYCANSSCATPTSFDYAHDPILGQGPTADNQGVTTLGGSWSLNAGNFVLQPADVDGDGYTDLIGFVVSNGSGHGVAYRGQYGNAPQTWTASGLNNNGMAAYGDFNGDGLTDVAWVSISGGCKLSVTIFTNQGAGTFAQSQSSTVSANSGCGGSLQQVSIGDFNGDGLDDIFVAGTNGSTPTIDAISVQSTSVYVNSEFTVNSQVLTSGTSFSVGDLNSDGETDFVARNPSSGLVITCLARLNNCISETLATGGQASLVDMNADGVPDLIIEQTSGTTATVTMYLGDGTGNFLASSKWVQTFSMPDNASQITFADYNGDGYVDLAFVQGGTAEHVVFEYLNTGNWSQNFSISQESDEGNSDGEPIQALSADLDGNGIPEVVMFYANSSGSGAGLGDLRQYAFVNLGVNDITDGYGSTINIAYQPLSSNSVYSDDGAGISSSQKPFRTPQNVVYSTTTTNPGNANRVVTYSYKDARYNVQGRGYLGFGQMSMIDSGSGMMEFKTFNQAFPYIGTQATDELRTATGLVVSNSFNSYHADYFSAYGSYFVYPIQSFARVYETSTGASQIVMTTENIINGYDATSGGYTALQTLMYSGDTNGTLTSNTVTSNTYTNDTSNWYLARLTDTVVTRTNYQSGDSGTRESSFTYNSGTGLLASEEVQPNDKTHWMLTQYQRDGFGNLVSSTVSGPNIQTRTSTAQFSASAPYYGRFKTQACNALNQCASSAFDTHTGNVTSSTDINGMTTSFSYDDFGRSTGSSLNQNGLSVSANVARSLCANGPWQALCNDATGAVYAVSSSKSDGSQSVKIFDANERAVEEASVDGDGAWVEVTTTYDSAGRKYQMSSPHYHGQSQIYYMTDAYDEQGRVKTETAPPSQSSANATTTYIYNGLTTTKIDGNGHYKTEVLNPMGKIVQSIGVGDTINDGLNSSVYYLYTAFDQLYRTTDSSGNVSQIFYDVLGHKIAMSDPDMGAWSYTPDVLGELLSILDAKGQTVSMAYDVLGRTIQRQENEDTTTWTYDTLWKGALTSVQTTNVGTSSPSYVRASTFTPFGGVNSQTETINSANYTMSYAYDNQGRVVQTTYPSGFSTAQGYSAYGPENLIYQPGNTSVAYWKATSWDQWGHVYMDSMGNGTTSLYYRDSAVGKISEMYTQKAGAIQTSLSYTWDNVGNITQRNEGDAVGRNDTYAYDNLNRMLTDTLAAGSVSSGGLPISTTTTLAYDALGNITSKSDIGSYTYKASGPHQVSLAGIQSYAYDANGNMTSATGRTYTWTSYNLPSKLAITAGSSASFTYGPERQRTSEIAISGVPLSVTVPSGSALPTSGPQLPSVNTLTSTTTATTFVGGGLFEGVVQSNSDVAYTPPTCSGTRCTQSSIPITVGGGNTFTSNSYIVAPVGVVAVVNQSSTGADTIQYFHRDAQGSVIAVTDSTGALSQQIVYDAFGKRQVNPVAVGISNPTTAYATNWGYTGHLELDDLNLVHMDGRVYDPTIGRFISADPNIQDPNDLQSYNRYSYVQNNPATFTDPSGFFLSGLGHWFKHNWRIFAAIAIAVVAAVTANYELDGTLGGLLGAYGTVAAGGFASGYVGSDGNLQDGLIGAVAAVAFFGIGQEYAPTGGPVGVGQEITDVVQHGFVGGLQTVAERGNFDSGFLSAAVPIGVDFGLQSAGINAGGPLWGTVKASVIGGTASVLGGGKFANGAVTGAFSYDFNEVAHIPNLGGVIAGDIGGGLRALGSMAIVMGEVLADAVDGVLGIAIPSELGDDSVHQLYRVVGPDELTKIEASDQFSPSPSGFGDKQFWTNLKDADWYANGSLKWADALPLTVVQITVTGQTYAMGVPFLDAGHLAISFGIAALPAVNADALRFGITPVRTYP